MMIRDGQKLACQACVRGHRVSNCNHADRDLIPIAKKGRPTSQCHHCRAMRKSRSSHVKCDCGEKSHKCAHLQKTVQGHSNSCCCNHGGHCTCSHKKEPSLDPVPEYDSGMDSRRPKPKPTSRRRRTDPSQSESFLNFDENGQRKPIKHTKGSQRVGPYPLSRGSSIHSTDSASGSGNRSPVNIVQYSKSSRRSRATASRSNHGTRLTKSEQASPSLAAGHTFHELNGQLPPLDLSNIRYHPYEPLGLFSSLPDRDALFSAGLSTVSGDWPQFDGLETSSAPSSFDPVQPYTGFGLAGSVEPGLSNQSGDVSEAEDFLPSAFSDTQLDLFPDGSAGNYMGLPMSQPVSLPSDNLFSNFDYDQFKGTAASSKFSAHSAAFEDANSTFSLYDEESLLGMNIFNDFMTQSPTSIVNPWDTT